MRSHKWVEIIFDYLSVISTVLTEQRVELDAQENVEQPDKKKIGQLKENIQFLESEILRYG